MEEENLSNQPIEPTPEAKSLSFPVIGQGTFFFTCSQRSSFSILVTPENKEDISPYDIPHDYIALRVSEDCAQFTMKMKEDANETTLVDIHGSGADSVGVDSERMNSYWYSYDSVGQTIKYGKGYTMESTTLMKYSFRDNCLDKEKQDELLNIFFNPTKKKFVWVYTMSTGKLTGLIDMQPTFSFQSEPFISDFPPIVLDSSKVKLFDLDRSEYMFSSSLPSACQELYGNIKGLVLEDPVDPIMKLSDAIRYSINTEGCLLNKTLKEKAHEFGPDKPAKPAETYLRVTLGPDQRTGPGIPYVLEIWPSGHYSPIHNHGGACAIIKVLFGRITVKVFNKMSNPAPTNPKVIKTFDGKEGDVTWISPEWYQTHQLKNRTDDFCATIQCYRYTDQDRIHYPGFDYIPVSGDRSTPLDEFYPNSDFSFVKLRFEVLEEYRKYLSGSSD